MTAALDAVRGGEADGAVVPIENSVEGAVPVTLDELATGDPLMITREMHVEVQFALLAKPGTDGRGHQAGRDPSRTPRRSAGAGCATHLPDAEVVLESSTAHAAALVAEPDSPYDAAIAAPIAAEHYRLATLATAIADNAGAVTRFVLVSRPGPPPPPTGPDKTSLVAFIRDDHPGALLEMLEQFAARGVNLTRIESRPTGAALGNYCFSIDCEGHVDDARVGEALMGLRRTCADVRFLGSYPRADGAVTAISAGTSDSDFSDAAAWLKRLRA